MSETARDFDADSKERSDGRVEVRLIASGVNLDWAFGRQTYDRRSALWRRGRRPTPIWPRIDAKNSGAVTFNVSHAVACGLPLNDPAQDWFAANSILAAQTVSLRRGSFG